MGGVSMSSPLSVDMRQVRKDLNKLGKTVQKTADNAVKVAIRQVGAFYMSFDDTESVPYVKEADGKITVSGPGLAKAADSIEDVLAIQTQVAAGTLQRVLTDGIKEALK